MKKLLTLTAAVAALSLSTLSAQTFESVRVHFDQAVQVANTSLPAGDYVITQVKSAADLPLLRFSSDRGINVVVFASREMRSGAEAAHTEVVLEKIGDTEQVARIELLGSKSNFVLPVMHR